MKKIKTYWWFWAMIPIFLFLSFIYADSQLDIPNIKWTSAFPLNNNGIYISIFLFFSGFGYIFKKVRKNRKLSVLHFFYTLIGLLVLTIPIIMFLTGPPRRYYSNTIEPTFFEFLLEMNYISLFATILIVLGIIIYFINLGIVIFKNKN